MTYGVYLLLAVQPPAFGVPWEVWDEWNDQYGDCNGHGALDDKQPFLESQQSLAGIEGTYPSWSIQLVLHPADNPSCNESTESARKHVGSIQDRNPRWQLRSLIPARQKQKHARQERAFHKAQNEAAHEQSREIPGEGLAQGDNTPGCCDSSNIQRGLDLQDQDVGWNLGEDI